MNPEIKAKWLEALRSGKYEQGRTLLRPEENKFCCLGVLCDIVDPSRWFGNEYIWSGISKIGMPQDGLLFELDIESSVADELANMNDGHATFAQIADYIEAHL